MDTFKGIIERITYYNDENGYSVIKVRPQAVMPQYTSRDGFVTIVGVMPELGVGEEAEFHGEWIEDPRYGFQMRVEMVQPIQPTSRKGIIRFLSSGIVKGISERRAEYIVDYFGKDTLKILDKNPERLKEVPQIKPAIAEALAQAWRANMSIRNTMLFLQRYGVSSSLANKIHAVYGTQTINKVSNNPYTLADEVYGIGFIKADSIARNMGLSSDSQFRIRAGLKYALSKLVQEGSSCVPRDILINFACEFLELNDHQRVDKILDTELSAKRLYSDTIELKSKETVVIYLPIFFKMEQSIVENLQRISKTSSALLEFALQVNWDKYLEQITKTAYIPISLSQAHIAKAIFFNKICSILTPFGTDKSTLLQLIISLLEQNDFRYALAAPTARASKELEIITNRNAYTLDKIFNLTPDNNYTADDSSSDKLSQVDLIIINASFMIDLVLLHHILHRLDSKTHLLFIGDSECFVEGVGNPIKDIVNSKLGFVTQVDDLRKNPPSQNIINNANRTKNGELPVLDNRSEDFFFFEEEDPFKAAELLVEVVTQRIPRKFGYDPLNDIQVLSPMYRGASGVDKLNEALQHALNPGSTRRAEKKMGGRVFRVGDKVMQTRNNYEKEVFNGDIGFIRAIDDDDNTIEVHMSNDAIFYDYTEAAEELIHAYCISIHRSQGSEYPVIVLPMLTQHFMMLQRNLIYTAITRARNVVVMVGNRQAVQMAVRNNKVENRYSGLLHRLSKPSGKLF